MPQDDGYIPLTPAQAARLTALHRAWFDPLFIGLEAVLASPRPALWVGNHTLYAMMDTPLFCERLLREGVVVRALGDRGHFKVPLWGRALVRAGMVLGSPENCRDLMAGGQHVLVFPGGGREVMRRRGEAYQLIWKRRTGFARMAIEHGYDIIPFGSLGPDEAYDIVADANDIMASRLWRWLDGRLPLGEMSRGGDMIPRPQRCYFGIGSRISTAGLGDDDEALWALREEVAGAIQTQLSFLRELRAVDRPEHWSRWRRWLAGDSA